MALQVKVDYGGERFATFLLRNVTYETLLQTMQRICSSLAHLGQDSIRLRYKDEGGDIQNQNKYTRGTAYHKESRATKCRRGS